MTRDVVPVLPYAYLCMFLDDSNKADRELGAKCSMEILRRCEEVWICGPKPDEDSQVWVEVEEAERMNKKVIDYSGLVFAQVFKGSNSMLCTTQDYRDAHASKDK